MAAGTKLIDRLSEYKKIIGGMGIVAGNTSHTKDNSVDIRHPVFFFPAHQISHIAVTGDAEGHRALSPKLITIVLTMRVVAEGTSSYVQGAVGHFT